MHESQVGRPLSFAETGGMPDELLSATFGGFTGLDVPDGGVVDCAPLWLNVNELLREGGDGARADRRTHVGQRRRRELYRTAWETSVHLRLK